MNEYNIIAGVYDRINSGIDYDAWADTVQRLFDRHLPSRPELVLDLACGTGKMTLALAKKGYDMIGVDSSGVKSMMKKSVRHIVMQIFIFMICPCLPDIVQAGL